MKIRTRSPLWRSSSRPSRLSLAGAARRQLALLAVGAEGLAALGRAVRQEDELGPAVGLAHVDARAAARTRDRARAPARIGAAPASLNWTYKRHHPVFGQVVAAELGDLAAVDDRADQLVQVRMRVIGAFRGRRQPQAERGDGAGRRQAVGRAGQVVAFVEDDEPKPVAQAVHVEIGRVVGRHGQRLDVVVSAAEQPDLDAEAERELVVPLVHQVDGGGDDQGGPAGPLDGHVGQVRLAGPGRQDDHAAAAGRPTRPSGPRPGAGTPPWRPGAATATARRPAHASV